MTTAPAKISLTAEEVEGFINKVRAAGRCYAFCNIAAHIVKTQTRKSIKFNSSVSSLKMPVT